MAFIFEGGVLAAMYGSKYSMISTIPVDVTKRETVTHDYIITSKPSEDGTKFSDNIIENPTVISFNGLIKGDLIGETYLDKKSMLDELRRQKEPFTFVGMFGTYQSMFFQSISFEADPEHNSVLKFSAVLNQVPIITAQTVTVPKKASKNPSKMAPKVDKGKVQAKKVTPTPQESQSFLSKLTGIGE